MSEPQFEPPSDAPAEPSRSSNTGWIAFGSIVTLLVCFQLIQYFFRDAKTEKSFFDTSLEYRMYVQLKELSKRYSSLKEIDQAAPKSIESLLAEVAPDKSSQSNAARLYVSMSYESGKGVSLSDLKVLEVSQNPADKSFAKIYKENKLSLEQARELSSKLGKTGFTFRMAEIHAYEKAGDKKARARLIPDSDLFKPLVANGLILGSGALGAGLLILYLIMRLNGQWKPAGHPVGRLKPQQADHFAGRAAVMLFAWILISVSLGLVLRKIVNEEAIGIIAELAVIGVVFRLATQLRDGQGRPVRLLSSPGRIWGDVGWGIGAVLANIPLLMCCAKGAQFLFKSFPPAEHPMTFELQANRDIVSVLLIGFAAAVMAPIFEETVFRGTVAPAMESLLGAPWKGIIASSLIFAAIHPTGVPAWPALAMIGSVAAMLVYQRGSLLTSMVFHAVHNGGLVVLMLLIY